MMQLKKNKERAKTLIAVHQGKSPQKLQSI